MAEERPQPEHFGMLLSPEEVGKALGMSRSWTYEQIRQGAIPSFRIGRKRKIRASDLERFVESLTTATKA